MVLLIIPWWLLFVKDSPSTKDQISCINTHPAEIALIEKTRFDITILEEGKGDIPVGVLSSSQLPLGKKKTTPWLKLVFNGPVLALCWANFCRMSLFLLFSTSC
jgi:hypothetical protein